MIQPTIYPPIEAETRPAVETAQAAAYLGRKPQTLRAWACHEKGPIRPVRVHGRLLWPMRDIRRLLGLEGGQ
ncbi:MAG: helix-turn-helix domain-containing protein [Alteraurantiacibacter sp.]|nr:helix-turn-helix domain-containing protein [Alteraurantiacibacter sp.]